MVIIKLLLKIIIKLFDFFIFYLYSGGPKPGRKKKTDIVFF
jgi:hypothetical protein